MCERYHSVADSDTARLFHFGWMTTCVLTSGVTLGTILSVIGSLINLLHWGSLDMFSFRMYPLLFWLSNLTYHLADEIIVSDWNQGNISFLGRIDALRLLPFSAHVCRGDFLVEIEGSR